MKQALILLGLVAAGYAALHLGWGRELAYSVAFGAVSVMAAMIAGTFFWLWRRRQTPLALGMGFSWAGAASVLGWWWVFHVLGEPRTMRESAVLLVFLGLYTVGAVLHFAVMQRSLHLRVGVFALPVLAAVALAAAVVLSF